MLIFVILTAPVKTECGCPMLFEVCDSIDVYGMIYDDYCEWVYHYLRTRRAQTPDLLRTRNSECTCTFASVAVDPMINAKRKPTPNRNPNLNPYPTPNQNPIITLTLTLCYWRYHHRSNYCRRSKCRITEIYYKGHRLCTVLMPFWFSMVWP